MERSHRTWTAGTLSLAAVVTATWCYLFTRHRIFWSDELFGWMLIADPRWSHMLQAWKAGADGGGIVFYVFGRWWLALFGHTALSFRAYSAAGVYAAFVAMWFLLCRFYRPGAAALLLLTVWFGCHLALWQDVQARFYGLLMAGVAFALYASAHDTELRREQREEKLSGLALLFATNLLLVNVHTFGALYSGLVLVGALLYDMLVRRLRPWAYVATVVPWASLWFSQQAIRNSAAVGKPWFWTTKPVWLDLRAFYHWDALPWIGWLLAGLVLLRLAVPAQRETMLQGVHERGAVLLPACLLALVPVGIWIVSQRGTSVFVDRYMVPFLLGIAILGTEAWTQLFPRVMPPSLSLPLAVRCATAAVLLIAAAWNGLWIYPSELELPPKDFTLDLARRLPKGVPIAFERIDIFDLTQFYRGSPDLPLFYPLDWGTALDPQSPRGLVSGQNEMKNWQKLGYFSDHIVNGSDFLAKTPHFILVDSDEVPWREKQIEGHPEWHTTKLGNFGKWPWAETLWDVRRVGAAH